jgi:hypothetical protein
MMPTHLPAYAGRTGPFPPSLSNLCGPAQGLGGKSGERSPGPAKAGIDGQDFSSNWLRSGSCSGGSLWSRPILPYLPLIAIRFTFR